MSTTRSEMFRETPISAYEKTLCSSQWETCIFYEGDANDRSKVGRLDPV